MSEPLHAAAVATLQAWTPAARGDGPAEDVQEGLRRHYLEHLGRHPDGCRRDGSPEHLTASCFVVDPTGTRTLLVLHRKGGFWVQPGGHLESTDLDLRGAACREALEETGLAPEALSVSAHPVDLDRHALSSAFGRCRAHLDVAYLGTADTASPTCVSAESGGLAWWPLDALPDGADGEPAVVADLPGRLRRALATGTVPARD